MLEQEKFYDVVFDADKRKANINAMKLANFLSVGELVKLNGDQYPEYEPLENDNEVLSYV